MEPRAASWLLACAALLLVLCLAGRADAQSSAAAQALFDDGVALRKAGKIEQACAKFQESLRLEATVGTRFNLADCMERLGKHATAWSQFLQVAADTERAGEPERAAAARARAKKLEPRLSKMIIEPARPAPGMVIERDGVAVGQPQWGTALPVDPGPHQVVAKAPGMKPWSQQVVVAGEGQLVTVQVPALEQAPAAAPGMPPPVPGPTAPPPGDQETSATPMILGITFGTVGVVGIAIGTALGVIAINKKGEVDDLCPDLNNCTEEGIAVNDEAKTAATVSTVGFIAGGALLVTGIVLWVALPSSSDAEASVGLSPTGLRVQGRF
jgi:hypothetical protein